VSENIPWYRSEAWLVVLLASFAIALSAAVAPRAFGKYLLVLAVLLAGVGVAMLVLREVKRQRT